MRIFRKERQPRANTRALASFAGRLVEVVLTIIDLVVEGAPETDDAARGSQQQERAARTGQRLGAHSIAPQQAPSWRRLREARRNVNLAIRIPGAYTPVTVAPARRPRKREPSLDQWL